MNLYQFHKNPESLTNHKEAHQTVPELILQQLHSERDSFHPTPKTLNIIARDGEMSYLYAQYILKKPWPPGEPAIFRSVPYAFFYASGVYGKRLPLSVEKEIAKHRQYALKYAIDIVKGKWPEGEETIRKSRDQVHRYNQMLMQKGYSDGNEWDDDDHGDMITVNSEYDYDADPRY